jgi:dipeptidyl aminopeptidase/acylaminoacyl peptidase
MPLLVASVAHADLWDVRAPVVQEPIVAKASSYSGLGADSITPEQIAKYAATPLPHDVSRHIQAMLDIRGAGTGTITKKGDRMYFASAVTGSSQVWRQDGPMKLAVQVTGGEDRTAIAGLSPDEKWLALNRDIGGEENPGLYVMDTKTGAVEKIQHTSKVQTTIQYWSDDSRSVYFRANDIAPDSYAIYRYDLATKQRTLVFAEQGLWNIADQRGTQWLMVKSLGETHQEVFTYDYASKKLTPILGQTEENEYDVRFGSAPGDILALTNARAPFTRLYRVSGTDFFPISPADLQHDIASFAIDEQRKRIYYVVNDRGYFHLRVVDAKNEHELALPAIKDAENIWLGSLSRDGRYAELTYDSATQPATTVMFDWQAKKQTTWRVATVPEIDTSTFAKASLESYPARDGTQIPMFVRRPTQCAEPCPVVVSFHGGPEGQSRPGFSATAQMWVDAGFVYVEPNVRGSVGYGKEWQHADDGPKRLNVITDIEDASKYVRAAWAKSGVSPKIGVTGGSYGGYSTLIAMSMFAGAYDAGVQQVGISNLATFLQNTSPYRRALRISEYGDPVKDKDTLAKLSPITYVDRVRAPLLSIQGVNDPRVPVGEAVQIYTELQTRKIPSELILFPDEGHGAAKRENRALTIGHSIDFFAKYLK